MTMVPATLNLPEDLGDSRFLMNGAEYIRSLDDGRIILDHSGQVVKDPVHHPALRSAIRRNAESYDMQFRSSDSEIVTYRDPETEMQTSTAWRIPYESADLTAKRAMIRWSCYRTLGFHGRPFDYGYGLLAGMLSQRERIRNHNTEWADNVSELMQFGKSRNLMTFSMAADVQSDRSVPVHAKPGRLRCVEVTPDGLVLQGAKPCGSGGPLAHLGYVTTLMTPGLGSDSLIYCAVLPNAPGLTMVLREPLLDDVGDTSDHPIDAIVGEEPDALMLFDNVFVPNEHIFNYGNSDLGESYYEVQSLTLWHVLSRLAYRAEILSATAQIIVDVLGTDRIPQVRDAVADVTAYADGLMAFVIASEETARLEGGILAPNERFVTAGRLYSVSELPRIMQALRDISGQGMITRMTARQWSVAGIGEALDEYLPGTGVSAKDKNALFNFVWDLVSSGHAMRVAMFESVNSLPPSGMRARIYGSQLRRNWMQDLTEYLPFISATDGLGQ